MAMVRGWLPSAAAALLKGIICEIMAKRLRILWYNENDR